MSQAITQVEIPTSSILYIDLHGVMPERFVEGTLLETLQYGLSDAPALDDVLNSIRLAAHDERVKCIYIDGNYSELGTASREEIVEALAEFKKSGKPIIAYADNFVQGDYYVASAADEVYLNPVGMIDIHGVASQTMFYTGLLDKLGIEMQVFKVGDFKSAVEPFILKQMSDSARLQAQTYVDGIWNQVATGIAKNRGIAADSVKAYAADMIFAVNPKSYVDRKLITGLKYRREVEDIVRKYTNTAADEDLPLVTPLDYMSNHQIVEPIESVSSQRHIAVYYAVGDIVDTGEGGIVGDIVVPDILALAKDDNVGALVLRVNSGGGSAFASEQIWDALEQFKKTGKPFYVSMGDVAASGGYYISSGADKIYCDPSTLTGSIGIFGIMPCFRGLVSGILDVQVDEVMSNPNAGFPSMFTPVDEPQRAAMQQMIERGYETFVGRCAAGRKMTVDQIKRIASGRVWYGLDAKRIGLVDEIGSLNTAVQAIAKKSGITADRVVQYPAIEENPLMMLLRLSGQSINVGTLPDASLFGDTNTEECRAFIHKIMTLSPVQARMEEVIIK